MSGIIVAPNVILLTYKLHIKTALAGKPHEGNCQYSWSSPDKSRDDAEFWNPKMRAPHCFNAQAARSLASIYLMKTRLVLAGKSQAEIAQAIATALDKNELPALELGAMAYMMSKLQYLNDRDKSWHPHVMF